MAYRTQLGLSSSSEIGEERVVEQYAEVVSTEGATSKLGFITAEQHFEAETLPSSHTTSSTSIHITTAAHSLEVDDESRRQECQGRTVSTQDDVRVTVADVTQSTSSVISTVTAQKQITVATVDEEGDANHHSTTLAVHTNEEVSKDISPVVAPDSATMFGVGVTTESYEASVAEDDMRTESEHLQYTSRMDGSYKQPTNPLANTIPSSPDAHSTRASSDRTCVFSVVFDMLL